MLRTVDIWLAEHCELALPPLPSAAYHRGYGYEPTYASTNEAARSGAARAFAKMLALARDYKLKRFSEAAKTRMDSVPWTTTAEPLLVMKALMDLVQE